MRCTKVTAVLVLVLLIPAVSFSAIRVVPKSSLYQDYLELKGSEPEKAVVKVKGPESASVKADVKWSAKKNGRVKGEWNFPEPLLRFIDFFVWDIR